MVSLLRRAHPRPDTVRQASGRVATTPVTSQRLWTPCCKQPHFLLAARGCSVLWAPPHTLFMSAVRLFVVRDAQLSPFDPFISTRTCVALHPWDLCTAPNKRRRRAIHHRTSCFPTKRAAQHGTSVPRPISTVGGRFTTEYAPQRRALFSRYDVRWISSRSVAYGLEAIVASLPPRWRCGSPVKKARMQFITSCPGRYNAYVLPKGLSSVAQCLTCSVELTPSQPCEQGLFGQRSCNAKRTAPLG